MSKKCRAGIKAGRRAKGTDESEKSLQEIPILSTWAKTSRLAAEQRDHAKSMARQPNDPARRAAELKYKKLMTDYDELWEIESKRDRRSG